MMFHVRVAFGLTTIIFGSSLADARQIGTPLAYFPKLWKASPEQRSRYEMSGGGTGLHWDELDEDISVPGLLAGVAQQAATV